MEMEADRALPSAPAFPGGGARHLVLTLCLALAQAGLLVHTAWDKSDTIDEGTYYIPRASWLLRDLGGRDLPRLWLFPQWAWAGALYVADPTGELWPREGVPWTELGAPWPPSGVEPDRLRRLLLAVRLPTIAVTVLGGLLLADAARRQGRAASHLAHALWCFSPTILAHGCLATLDPWLGALSCAVLWTLMRFREAPTLPRAAAVGGVLGLALSTKLTSVLFLPVAAVVMAGAIAATARPGGRFSPLLRASLAGAGGLALSIWAAYRLTVGPLDPDLLRTFGAPAIELGRLPAPRFVEGLFTQVAYGAKGHQAYLFGEVRHTGWWWFYLAVLALQTTLGAQALALLRTAAWLRLRPSRAGLLEAGALLAYPALLFGVLSAGSAQSGARYLLPAFPPVLLALSGAARDVPRAFGRVGTGLLALCVAMGLAGSLAVHPDHLMFFNAWAGGPDGGPRYLIHSNDWGQDQRRLGEWQAANGLPWVYYTYYNGHPEAWGIRYQDVPCTPKKGIYALHAVEVHRPRRIEEGCLDWLTVEPPDQRLGHSIYVYVVDKTRLERLRHPTGPPFWRSALPAP